MLLFALELTRQCLVVEDYKWSFFFWLDTIATASLIPDIKWIVDPLTAMYGGGEDQAAGGQGSVARAGRASRAGTRAGRIVRLVRLVRLIRIVKLYKRAVEQQDKSAQKEGTAPGDDWDNHYG